MTDDPALIRYADRGALATGLADVVAHQLLDAIDARGRASLAVPGGTTPGPFLHDLGARPLPWDRISVMLTDERFVPETSDRSNTRLLRATLLQGPASAASFLPFTAEAPTPEDALQTLTPTVEAALPLDVLILGMGEDMHTASLFPGADRLAEALSAHAPTLLPMRAPGAPEPRVTLTAPILRAARATHLLITGPAKLEALARARTAGSEAEAPVRVVLPTAQIHHAD